MSHSKNSTAVPQQWSSALADRYGFVLPADLADWFDSDAWRRDTGGEFDHPVSPQLLLEQAPSILWPGFMQPDTLPLLGNRYGDWLCLRVGANNTIVDVVHWYHGGGDWIPWGKSLADAVAFDILRCRLPGRRQYYANVAAEFDQHLGATTIPGWAANWLPEPIGNLLRPDAPQSGDHYDLAELMIDGDVARIAVQCEMILQALDSPLRTKLTPTVAQELGVSWEPDSIRWMFDNALIPPGMLVRLDDYFGDDQPLVGQDWRKATQIAGTVAARRDDLGWALDIRGWAAEQSGDLQAAIEHYAKSLRTSSFSDQSIRFRTHWFDAADGKFAAARLQHLRPHWSAAMRNDAYLQLFLESKSQSLPSRVTAYWMRVAEQASQEGRHNDAYNAYYRAGWDMGLGDMNVFEQLLFKMADAAAASGQVARQKIALTHAARLTNLGS